MARIVQQMRRKGLATAQFKAAQQHLVPVWTKSPNSSRLDKQYLLEPKAGTP